jgi:hypothetical protein
MKQRSTKTTAEVVRATINHCLLDLFSYDLLQIFVEVKYYICHKI